MGGGLGSFVIKPSSMTDIKEKIVDELHRPARRNYPRRRVILKGIDDLWQADLIEVQPYARFNGGNRFILIVIDCLSKYVWVAAIKAKSAAAVTTGFKTIFEKAHPRIPRHLQTDQGKEFYNSPMRTLLSRHNINHYSTYSNLKASIVERVIRTIKTLLWKQFSIQGNYKWIDIIGDIVTKYNSMRHRSIKMAPADVRGKRKESLALKTLYDAPSTKKMKKKTPKFKLGDHVRISKKKAEFEKGYTPSWSTEIFKVVRVKRTVPPTYILEDSEKKPIAGGFYEEELQLTKYPNVFLIERVLRRDGDRAYVKWLGFDSRHNSWVNTANFVTSSENSV